jgi:hypothetical protein
MKEKENLSQDDDEEEEIIKNFELPKAEIGNLEEIKNLLISSSKIESVNALLKNVKKN